MPHTVQPPSTVSARARMRTFCTDSNQFHTLAGDEFQSLLEDRKLVDPHFDPLLPGWQLVPRDYLQQFQQLQSITEVFVDLFNEIVWTSFPQMRVTPCSEGLTSKDDSAVGTKSTEQFRHLSKANLCLLPLPGQVKKSLLVDDLLSFFFCHLQSVNYWKLSKLKSLRRTRKESRGGGADKHVTLYGRRTTSDDDDVGICCILCTRECVYCKMAARICCICFRPMTGASRSIVCPKYVVKHHSATRLLSSGDNISSSLTLGLRVEVRRSFTQKDVQCFAELSGDDNPIHVSEEYAKKGKFGRPIVHGTLLLGSVHALLMT